MDAIGFLARFGTEILTRRHGSIGDAVVMQRLAKWFWERIFGRLPLASRENFDAWFRSAIVAKSFRPPRALVLLTLRQRRPYIRQR